MDKNGKHQWRQEIEDYLVKSQAIFLTNYAGMTVEELTTLRRDLKKTNADFRVVKNTLAKKAIQGKEHATAAELFSGQVGVVFAYEDIAAAAKVISESVKKIEKLSLVGGVLEGQLLTPEAIEALASLPSKEVLLSRIIGSLVAPHRGLLGILQGVPRAMVNVLNQVKEKIESNH